MVEGNDDGAGGHECGVCGRTFDSAEALAAHVREAGIVE
jgi:hypothetical protein